jgi:hypothetical protein
VQTQHLTQFLNETEQNYRSGVKQFVPTLIPCLPAAGAQIVDFRTQRGEFLKNRTYPSQKQVPVWKKQTRRQTKKRGMG